MLFLSYLGVRPYKCAECSKAFTQRCSLESHLLKVHGNDNYHNYKQRRSKIFVCEECGHTTRVADEYYDHIRDNHPDSAEMRKYQDKLQLQKLVMEHPTGDGSSSSSSSREFYAGSSASGSSGGSSPTLFNSNSRSPEPCASSGGGTIPHGGSRGFPPLSYSSAGRMCPLSSASAGNTSTSGYSSPSMVNGERFSM